MEMLGRLARRATLVAAGLFLITGFGAPPPAVAQSSEDTAKTLRASVLLFRHSVVSPKYTLPKVETEWPMGYRQLTAVGMADMYAKGQALRRKYVDELGLIGEAFHASEVYVRASNTDRSLQTAQMLMLGLYPPGTGPDPKLYDPKLEAAPAPGLAFTPVPIHAVALENDAVLRPWTKQAGCQRYRKFIKALPKTKLYNAQAESFEDFLTRVTKITGYAEGEKAAKVLYEVNQIYEPLSANVQHNLPLPEGIGMEEMKQLRDLADWNYHHQFLGKKVGRLVGGPFVKEVIARFTNVVKSEGKAHKLYIYSGHQRTILGLEAALGIETARVEGPLFAGRVPPLASHYTFELHETAPGEHAIRLLFVSDKLEERVVQIPGCDSEMCRMKQFIDVVAEVIPQNWRKECQG